MIAAFSPYAMSRAGLEKWEAAAMRSSPSFASSSLLGWDAPWLHILLYLATF